jgi:hypothetical protein
MRRRDFLKLPALGAISALRLTSAGAALVPPVFIDCVVALGFSIPTLNAGQVTKVWHTIGTGFFYGFLVADDVI